MLELRALGVDDDQLIGLGIRKGVQEHSVHHREERGVHANAERQRDHSNACEPEILVHGADGEAHILGKSLEQRESALRAICFRDSLHSS